MFDDAGVFLTARVIESIWEIAKSWGRSPNAFRLREDGVRLVEGVVSGAEVFSEDCSQQEKPAELPEEQVKRSKHTEEVDHFDMKKTFHCRGKYHNSGRCNFMRISTSCPSRFPLPG